MSNTTEQIQTAREEITGRLEALGEAAREQWAELADDELAALLEAGEGAVDQVRAELQGSVIVDRKRSLVLGSVLLAILTTLVVVLLNNNRKTITTG